MMISNRPFFSTPFLSEPRFRLSSALAAARASDSATAGSSMDAACALSSSTSKFQLETPCLYASFDAASACSSPSAFDSLRLRASRSASMRVRSPSDGMLSNSVLASQSAFFASLRNLCSSSLLADGRLDGSFCRHRVTNSRSAREKCLPSACFSSSVGAGFCNVMSKTFMGGYFENGACPWHSSNTVIPRDQISA